MQTLDIYELITLEGRNSYCNYCKKIFLGTTYHLRNKQFGQLIELSNCPCGQISLFLDPFEGFSLNFRQNMPARLPDYVPAKYNNLYKKAIKILPIDPKMSLVNARKCLELLLKNELKCTKKFLNDKIKQVKKLNIFSPQTIRYINKIKKNGNDGAHKEEDLSTLDKIKNAKEKSEMILWMLKSICSEIFLNKIGQRQKNEKQ